MFRLIEKPLGSVSEFRVRNCVYADGQWLPNMEIELVGQSRQDIVILLINIQQAMSMPTLVEVGKGKLVEVKKSTLEAADATNG